MRSTVKIVAGLLIAVGLSGCGLGQAQTNTASMRGVGNGVDINSSEAWIHDVTIVNDGDSVGVSATAINKSDAEISLNGVEIGTTKLTLIDAGLPVTTGLSIAPGAALRIGFESTTSAVAIAALKTGEYTPVTFTFTDGSIVSGEALIVSKTGIYSGVVTDLPVAG